MTVVWSSFPFTLAHSEPGRATTTCLIQLTLALFAQAHYNLELLIKKFKSTKTMLASIVAGCEID
jgi:hypothetical protein